MKKIHQLSLSLIGFMPIFAFAQSQVAKGPLVTPTYQSTFDSYQKFNDQPLTGWKQINETVEKIGGWRVYAQEARAPDKPAKPAKPDKVIDAGKHDKHGVKP